MQICLFRRVFVNITMLMIVVQIGHIQARTLEKRQNEIQVETNKYAEKTSHEIKESGIGKVLYRRAEEKKDADADKAENANENTGNTDKEKESEFTPKPIPAKYAETYKNYKGFKKGCRRLTPWHPDCKKKEGD